MTSVSKKDDNFIEMAKKFENFIRKQNDGGIFSFNDGFIDQYEGYKKEIPKGAKEKLESETWTTDWIGTGKILNHVLDAVEYETENSNNLVDWRKRKVFFEWFLDKPEQLRHVELIFFDLFTGDTKDDANNFDRLCNSGALGAIYDLISYLFYIKNPGRYLPNKPKNFQVAFKLLGDRYYLEMSRHCSWENYQAFLGKMEEIRLNLVNYFSEQYEFNEEISLIDAHSFCWIISHNLEEIKEIEPISNRSDDVVLVLTGLPKGSSEGDLKPKGPRKFKPVSPKERKKQELRNIRIGSAGELYVWDAEKKRLKSSKKPYLAEMMYHASKEEGDGLGYDIISFTPDGEIKFIEVKTTTGNKNTKFIISDNELEFSSMYPDNYYLYRIYDFNNNAKENRKYVLQGNMREKLATYPIQVFALPRE